MNFIKDRELALRFKNNAVPSKERFLYILLFMGLTTLVSSSFFISSLYPTQPNQWDAYIDLSIIAITILGTIACYQSNKSGDDKEFIERYISIGFPVAIRTLLILIPVMIIFYGFVEFIRKEEIPDTSSMYDLVLNIGFMIYFYWRLNSSIKLASN